MAEPTYAEEKTLADIIDNIIYYFFTFEQSSRKCEDAQGTLKTWVSEDIETLYNIRYNILELEEKLKQLRRTINNRYV